MRFRPRIKAATARRKSPRLAELYWKCPWSIRMRGGRLSMDATTSFLPRATILVAGSSNRRSVTKTVPLMKSLCWLLSSPLLACKAAQLELIKLEAWPRAKLW